MWYHSPSWISRYKIDEKRCLANLENFHGCGENFRPRGHGCHGFIFSSWFFASPWPWKCMDGCYPGCCFLLGLLQPNGGWVFFFGFVYCLVLMICYDTKMAHDLFGRIFVFGFFVSDPKDANLSRPSNTFDGPCYRNFRHETIPLTVSSRWPILNVICSQVNQLVEGYKRK